MTTIDISTIEMIEFIYKKSNKSISKDIIELIISLQEDFLISKGLITIEEDDLY